MRGLLLVSAGDDRAEPRAHFVAGHALPSSRRSAAARSSCAWSSSARSSASRRRRLARARHRGAHEERWRPVSARPQATHTAAVQSARAPVAASSTCGVTSDTAPLTRAAPRPCNARKDTWSGASAASATAFRRRRYSGPRGSSCAQPRAWHSPAPRAGSVHRETERVSRVRTGPSCPAGNGRGRGLPGGQRRQPRKRRGLTASVRRHRVGAFVKRSVRSSRSRNRLNSRSRFSARIRIASVFFSADKVERCVR
jgi:hypothetical protein